MGEKETARYTFAISPHIKVDIKEDASIVLIFPTGKEAENQHQHVFEAAMDGDEKTLITILETEGFQCPRDKDGNTPLHMCLGHYRCTKLLISHGVGVNIQNKFGRTALHQAARHDFVESLVQLLNHGADVNGTTNTVDGEGLTTEATQETRSPIELSMQYGSKASAELLLFCGAKVPEDWIELTPDERIKHDTILKGFSAGKIAYGGATLTPSPEFNILEKLDIHLKLGIDEKDDVEFICRRLSVEYQSSGLNSAEIDSEIDERLISDIYQYRVNRGSSGDIRIPVYGENIDSLNEYKDMYLRQVAHIGIHHSGNSQEPASQNQYKTDGTIRDKKAEFAGVRFITFGEGALVSFGVFCKDKVDKETDLDHTKDQTFKSSVNSEFRVTKPAGALAGANELAMKVIRNDLESNSSLSQDSDYASFSDIYSVTTSGGSATSVRPTSARSTTSLEGDVVIDIIIELPGSRSSGSALHTVVVGCPQDSKPTESEDWDVVDHKCDGVNKPLKVKSGCGSYIVVSLKKIGKIGYALKEMVKDLYNQITGTSITCVLLAAVKPMPDHDFQYVVRVTLCLEHEQNGIVQTLQQQQFFPQETKKEMSISKKKTYFLHFKLRSENSKVLDNDKPIHYQARRKECDFQVKCDRKKETFGNIELVKTLKKMRQSKCVLPVYFKTKERPTREEFPSTKFIATVSDTEGMIKDYFEIGIFLELPEGLLLDTIRHDPIAKERCLKVLEYWVDTFLQNDGHNKHEALNTLFRALNEAGRRDIRAKFVKEISRNPNSVEARWLAGFKVEGHQQTFNFDRLKEDFIVDPFEDSFLFIVAKEQATDLPFLLRLNSGNEKEIEQTGNHSQADGSSVLRAFDTLKLARRKDGNDPPTKSLMKLIRELRDSNNKNLFLRTLESKLAPWFKRAIDSRSTYSERKWRAIQDVMNLIRKR